MIDDESFSSPRFKVKIKNLKDLIEQKKSQSNIFYSTFNSLSEYRVRTHDIGREKKSGDRTRWYFGVCVCVGRGH